MCRSSELYLSLHSPEYVYDRSTFPYECGLSFVGSGTFSLGPRGAYMRRRLAPPKLAITLALALARLSCGVMSQVIRPFRFWNVGIPGTRRS